MRGARSRRSRRIPPFPGTRRRRRRRRRVFISPRARNDRSL